LNTVQGSPRHTGGRGACGTAGIPV
jgi:hypothetical protein